MMKLKHITKPLVINAKLDWKKMIRKDHKSVIDLDLLLKPKLIIIVYSNQINWMKQNINYGLFD